MARKGSSKIVGNNRLEIKAFLISQNWRGVASTWRSPEPMPAVSFPGFDSVRA